MTQTTTSRKGVGGRPNKKDAKPDEYRGKQTSQRWTVSEHLELREKAASAGLTVTEFIRRAALSASVVDASVETNSVLAQTEQQLEKKIDRLIYEVNAVGVNLLQYIRDDRFGRGHRTPQDWDGLYDRLHAVLLLVSEELE